MNRTEKVIQFGEGGFLRGFADWMIQIANEKAGFDGKVGFGPIDDLLTILQVGFNLNVIFAPVFIRDVDSEIVFVSSIVLSLNSKRIFSGLAIVQKQLNVSNLVQRYTVSAAGLETGDGGDPDVFCVRTSNDLVQSGAISASDMTTEAAIAKLYYLFSCGYDTERVKLLMETNLRGEMNE